jgi:hypothetical protein
MVAGGGSLEVIMPELSSLVGRKEQGGGFQTNFGADQLGSHMQVIPDTLFSGQEWAWVFMVHRVRSRQVIRLCSGFRGEATTDPTLGYLLSFSLPDRTVWPLHVHQVPSTYGWCLCPFVCLSNLLTAHLLLLFPVLASLSKGPSAGRGTRTQFP